MEAVWLYGNVAYTVDGDDYDEEEQELREWSGWYLVPKIWLIKNYISPWFGDRIQNITDDDILMWMERSGYADDVYWDAFNNDVIMVDSHDFMFDSYIVDVDTHIPWYVILANKIVRKYKDNDNTGYAFKTLSERLTTIFAQKAIGMLLIALSVFMAYSPLLYDPMLGGNDCTACFITLPIGLLLLFSRNICIN